MGIWGVDGGHNIDGRRASRTGLSGEPIFRGRYNGKRKGLSNPFNTKTYKYQDSNFRNKK